MGPRAHIALMLHQLRSLRAALLLAFALDRALVLPPLVCGLDKYWAPLSPSGVIPGAPASALPIVECPLDHLLNPAELKPSAEAHVRCVIKPHQARRRIAASCGVCRYRCASTPSCTTRATRTPGKPGIA
jgi:hypothetical protein